MKFIEESSSRHLIQQENPKFPRKNRNIQDYDQNINAIFLKVHITSSNKAVCASKY
jgi:hypothetical protein